jgi:AcrR family transcriptional regulator
LVGVDTRIIALTLDERTFISVVVAAMSGRAARPGGASAAVAAPPLPTREAILDAAERLFSAHGVDGVAVRDLARELQLTPSSLYNHFPGKQALYEAVLERGLRPIVELVQASWRDGELRRDYVAMTVNGLVTHLAQHPNLGRLLQRALLEETGSVQDLIVRWLSPLYRDGLAIIGRAAESAGWSRDEVPHIGLGLFGLVFAYFVNAVGTRRVAAGGSDPLGSSALAIQRRFLEEAILRLLGPRETARGRKSRRRSAHG